MRKDGRECWKKLVSSLHIVYEVLLIAKLQAGIRHTNAHQNKESRHETSEIRQRIARIVDEIIWVCTSRADPIGQRSNDVCRDHDQRKEVVPDGRGKDDKEETDGEDLITNAISMAKSSHT